MTVTMYELGVVHRNIQRTEAEVAEGLGAFGCATVHEAMGRAGLMKPTLRFVIPHGGGAAPYHWGRYRGLAQELKRPPLKQHLLDNVFFDTCVYHQPGIDLLATVIPAANILFASEMIGAVRGVDPETGHNYDDTKRYIEATLNLDDDERRQIYEGNARRVYPRLDAALKARGK